MILNLYFLFYEEKKLGDKGKHPSGSISSITDGEF
jgi:hypothetical protein